MPPSTADRKVSGVSWWSSDDAGNDELKRGDTGTSTVMIGATVAAGNCGTSPSGTKIGTSA